MSRKRVILCSLVLIWISACKSESDFFVARQYKKYYDYYCVTNTSFALSYIVDPIEETLHQKSIYVPEQKSTFHCDIKNNFCTTNHFLKHPWWFQSGLSTIVLDERWEEMDMVKTEFVDGNKYTPLRFVPVLKLNTESFIIAFSIRTKKEGHIFLCDGQIPSESNCYWLMLQAFRGEGSAIRKCGKGYVPATAKTFPTEPCATKRINVTHPDIPYYLSGKKWSHFLLTKRDAELTFSVYDEHKKRIIFQWRDTETPITVTNMILNSKLVNGLWKIHNLDVITTTSSSEHVELGPPIYATEGFVCISIYVLMCRSCSIKLSLAKQKEIINEMTYIPEHIGWNQIKFLTNNVSNAIPMRLLVSTISQGRHPYWELDKFRFCRQEEFRVIGLTAQATCQLMSGEDNLITFQETPSTSQSKCPEDAMGPFCAKCNSIFYDCRRISICDKNQCVCSPGYHGEDCYYECGGNAYGHGCQKSCGKCKYTCDKIDGTCSDSSCKENYSGPKCDIPPSIFFAEPPNVTNVTYDGATISVSDFEIPTRKSGQEPQYYLIQYKKADDSNSAWSYYNESFVFNVPTQFRMNNLNSQTRYLVRSVIVTTTGQSQLGEHLKYAEFTTTCLELTDDNIYIKPYDTSVFITLVETMDITCKSYTMSLFEDQQQSYTNATGTYFDDLEPFTEYTLRVKSSSQTHEKKFMTTEEADIPEAPYDFKIHWTPENDLVMEWKHPNKTKYNIKYFDISVSLFSYESVLIRKKLIIPNRKYNLTYNYKIDATELQPSTQYTITVFAFNCRPGINTSAQSISPPEIPTLAAEPLLDISNGTIGMTILPKNFYSKTDNYRIIVLRSDKKSNLESYPVLQKFDLRNLIVSIDCDVTNAHGVTFLILGKPQPLDICKDINNSLLEPATFYNVTILLLNTYSRKTRTTIYSLAVTTDQSTETNSALFALFVLLLIIPAIAYCYIKKKQQVRQPINFEQGNVNGNGTELPLIVLQAKTKRKIEDVNTTEIHQGVKAHSKLVSLRNFDNYVKTVLENQELKRQYEDVLGTALTYETLTVDTLKSDYVDMDFNSGLQIKNAYIITKLPTTTEFQEFWKRIVDENIRHIILFNHLQPGQKESKNYWPVVGNTMYCDNIIIECNMCEKHTFYTRRKFSLKCKSKIRKIVQLHLSLPPNDPQYLSSLNYLLFFQKMSKIPHSSKSPILVQSSAGIPGISFALLCDMSLRSAQIDGAIDVVANFKKLLQTTAEMKIDFDHYVAAHAIIADNLNYIDTSFTCNSFDASKSQVFALEEIQKHLEYLKNTLWLDKIALGEEKGFYVNSPTVLLRGEMLSKRWQLGQLDFIKVDGFKAPGKFWVAKQPSSMPLSDFLGKVQEKNILVIVVLNDNIFTWPNEEHPEMVVSSDLTLKYKFIKKLRSYDWITLELSTNTTNQTVEVVSFKNWSAPVVSLPRIDDFVNFVTESNEIFQNTESVLVTCHDGVTSSGLYLAMSYNIQKIKSEGICDVCTCIRTVRRHCQDFVKGDEQYIFLLEAARSYITQFSLYEVR